MRYLSLVGDLPIPDEARVPRDLEAMLARADESTRRKWEEHRASMRAAEIRRFKKGRAHARFVFLMLAGTVVYAFSLGDLVSFLIVCVPLAVFIRTASLPASMRGGEGGER